MALQHLKVIFCLDRAGLVGEDGATHQGVFDMSLLRSVPNLAIASPYDEKDLHDLLYSATLPHYPAIIIRYPRGCGEGVQWRGTGFKSLPLGRAVLRSEGSQVALLSIGPIGNKCAKAAAEAKKRFGCGILHYDMRFLKPIDTEALEKACSTCRRIITVEDGVTIGGLYGAVSEYVASRGADVQVVPVGVPDKFIDQASVAEQYAECGMTWENILEKIADYFGN